MFLVKGSTDILKGLEAILLQDPFLIVSPYAIGRAESESTMKYCVILADGMADNPIDLFGGETPLSAAHTPYMDALAKMGHVGMVATTPTGYDAGSDTCNMQVLGYNVHESYTGRAPLEAAAQNLPISADEVVFRCNLVTVADGHMVDYSAGAISTEEGAQIIALLNKELGDDRVRFYAGKGYRHLMFVKGMPELATTQTTPPHDITSQAMQNYLPKGEGDYYLQQLMARSHDILMNSDLNQVRLDLGENPANMMWLWGQGKAPSMQNFKEKFGIQGSVISAVDLLNGIGNLIGFESISVPGITGYYNTNYKGKAEYALKALETNDLIFVHIEAPDEEGHSGNALLKMRAIEKIDRYIVKPFYERALIGEVRVLVLPDHPTPVATKTHSNDPVPFVVAGKNIKANGADVLSEKAASATGSFIREGYTLMDSFLKATLR